MIKKGENKMKITPYNKEKEMNELMKKYELKNSFNEMVKAGIPFAFTAAVANDEKKGTKYMHQTVTPKSMGLELADDKFADLTNVVNGFKTVMDIQYATANEKSLTAAENAKGNSDSPFYDSDSVSKFEEKQGVELIKSDEDLIRETYQELKTSGVITQNNNLFGVDESVVHAIIEGAVIPGVPETEKIKETVDRKKELFCEDSEEDFLEIEWGTGDVDTQSYDTQSYDEIMEEIRRRHQNIRPGTGDFHQ